MENEKKTVRNSNAAWDAFDSDAYVGSNYAEPRGDDKKVLAIGAQHFADSGVRDCVAVDAGAGANLYPALSMLPWCRRLVLLEYSAGNVEYLRRQVEELDEIWAPYWEVVSPFCGGRPFSWARQRLNKVAVVEHGSIIGSRGQFRLSSGELLEAGMGTMHFVAESLSEEYSEFEEANLRFMGILNGGAPFSAAYMKESHGYEVGGVRYPATPVDENDVEEVLRPYSYGLDVQHVLPDPAPLRPGEPGFVMAVGKRTDRLI